MGRQSRCQEDDKEESPSPTKVAQGSRTRMEANREKSEQKEEQEGEQKEPAE